MKTLKTLMSSCLLILFTLAAWAQPKTSVSIISTIHGAHKTNPNYSYADLFAYIEAYQPDLIGVEIRPEDMEGDTSYLANNYPFEMRECIAKYTNRKVVGFDWLGSDLEGKAIPENYWAGSAIKKLQKQLNSDSLMLSRLGELGSLAQAKAAIALQASQSELNSGKYDSLNTVYYQQMATKLQGTPYQGLSDFYQQRDQAIADNIIRIIEENPGKKLIFLMGADHRSYSLQAIKTTLGDQIQLLAP